jgi:hypothetical protein
MGGALLESRYVYWYFDGFAYAFYTNAAIVQLESIFSPPCVSIITESLLLQNLVLPHWNLLSHILRGLAPNVHSVYRLLYLCWRTLLFDEWLWNRDNNCRGDQYISKVSNFRVVSRLHAYLSWTAERGNAAHCAESVGRNTVTACSTTRSIAEGHWCWLNGEW